MAAFATLYVEWTIRCKRSTCPHHSDPVRLRPRDPGMRPRAIEKSSSVVLALACPSCGLVFDYTESDVHQETLPLQPDTPQLGTPLSNWSDFVCGAQNCNTLVRLCAPMRDGETPAKAVERLQRDAQFDVRCPNGHPVVFPSDLGSLMRFPAGPTAVLFE